MAGVQAMSEEPAHSVGRFNGSCATASSLHWLRLPPPGPAEYRGRRAGGKQERRVTSLPSLLSPQTLHVRISVELLLSDGQTGSSAKQDPSQKDVKGGKLIHRMVAAVVFQAVPAGIGCWLKGAGLAPGSTLIIITTHCNSHVNHSSEQRRAEGRGAG
ncbi:hypothetical protein NQZ68_022085 [Dissostichus eleginoides]|nr:hypothetical protein NQZ68_022085 [Dissostichus eleginoides]